MSIKQKLLNELAAHPKLAAFGISLALTMAVGIAIGMFDVHSVAAIKQYNTVHPRLP